MADGKSFLAENIGHVVNFVVIVAAAFVFVTEIKTQTTVISERLANHLSLVGHSGMVTNNRTLAIEMGKLAGVVQRLQNDIAALERKAEE